MVYLGPLCATETLEDAGFDPLTGMGHGRLYVCREVNAQGVAEPPFLRREPLTRTWFGTRHAVPLPVGIPLGCLVMALALRLRPRTPMPRSAVSGSTDAVLERHAVDRREDR